MSTGNRFRTVHSGRVHYGGGEKTVPKGFEGFSMLFSHIWQQNKIYVRFSLFGVETHFITKFPYF